MRCEVNIPNSRMWIIYKLGGKSQLGSLSGFLSANTFGGHKYQKNNSVPLILFHFQF